MDCVHIPVHRNLCRERHSRRCAFKGTNFCQTDLSGDRAFLVGNTLLIQALCRTMPYMQRQNLLYIYIYNSGPPTGKEGNAIWNYIYAEDIYFYKSAGIYGYAFYANACVDFVAIWRRARLPVFISWKVLAQVHSLQSSRWGPWANPCYRRASRTLFKAWHEIPRCSCQHSIDSDSTKSLQYSWMAQWLWELDCERFDLLNRRSVPENRGSEKHVTASKHC